MCSYQVNLGTWVEHGSALYGFPFIADQLNNSCAQEYETLLVWRRWLRLRCGKQRKRWRLFGLFLIGFGSGCTRRGYLDRLRLGYSVRMEQAIVGLVAILASSGGAFGGFMTITQAI